MMRLPRLLSAALSFTLLIIGSCTARTYHMAPLPDQRVELSSSELCRIYVLRSEESRASLRRILVFDGESTIGSFAENEYVCWERRPGPLRITVIHELQKSEGGNRQEILDVATEAGEVRFYGVTIAEHGSVPSIQPLAPEEARELLTRRRAPQTLEAEAMR